MKIRESGQALLIVILVMVVGLTVALAVISRSVTDIRISQQEKESARVFSAAEAGIEEALKEPDLGVWGERGVTVGDLTATVKVTETNTFKTEIERNETAEVNLDDFTGGRLDVTWGNSGLELILVYESGGYKIARWALKNGSCDTAATFSPDFTDVSTMPFTINFADYPIVDPKVLRVRPICASPTVTVTGDEQLPPQSYVIRSEVTGLGGETRTVEVTKSRPILPPIFDYVLFSGRSL